MSAIPWIGQDIVESKIHLEYLKHSLLFILVLLMLIQFNTVKCLPKIGITNPKSRSNKSNWLSEAEYLSIPSSFLGFLAGVIDGDGFIGITKSQKGFVSFNLVISIHLDDIALLNYIQSVLKIGKIYTYTNRKSPTARLIFNKTELQEVFFPLLLYHGIFFLTKTRRMQFNMAMHILNKDIKNYSELPKVAPVIQKLPTSAEGYVSLSFFKNWIVGFVVAEGSFFIKSNNEGCFQVKQRLHILLFDALKLIFNTTRKITSDKSLHSQFSVSSKADIQNVINFFSFSGQHPLVGLKAIQYSAWLDKLRSSERYGKLNFPN